MLHQYIEQAVKLNTNGVFIKTNEGSYNYGKVYEKVLFFKEILITNGIQHGDRVLIYSSKNEASIALMMACSMCQAVYIPVSSLNPALRAKYIAEETGSKFIFCDENCGKELLKTNLSLTPIHSINGMTLFAFPMAKSFSEIPNAAFILFTSGSTGTPKGVVITHAAAMEFINWAADEFQINEQDILASIAPFSFDLSVFDIFVTLRKFATLVLYPESETKNVLLMAQKIANDKVTTIYGTPTFYSSLALFGKLHKYDFSSLKNVLFAGEVFHLEAFNALLNYWPKKKYANLYGPTETNVCTFFKVDLQHINYQVFPIGQPCPYAILKVIDEEGNEITEYDKKGELLVAGESLFSEYWNDHEKTKSSAHFDVDNKRYYKTGDIVYKNSDANFVYVGRNDRMIKKNGFRIEPMEIEKVMLTLPGVSNAAVCFSKKNNQLCCFLENPDITILDEVELKKFCQKQLPPYMIPDKFVLLRSMPKTSSGKIDLRALNNQL